MLGLPPKGTEQTEKKRSQSSRKTFVTLKKVARINMTELQHFVEGKVQINGNILTAIQVMDIIFRYHPLMNYLLVGRSFFSLDRVLSSFRGGFDLIEGIFQSVRPSKGLMTLNLDVAFTMFLRSMPLIDFVCEIFNRSRSELQSFGSWTPYQIANIERKIRGLLIVPQHRRGSSQTKTYKILKLTRTGPDETMFSLSASATKQEKQKECSSTATTTTTTISVANYFLQHYNISLNFKQAPCLVLHAPMFPSKQMYLPIEVCKLAPGHRVQGNMSEEQTSMMIRQTALKPQLRFQKIQALASSILKLPEQSSFLKKFGIQIQSSSFLRVQARLLPAPMMEAGGKKLVSLQHGSSQQATLHTPVKLSAIGILNLTGLPLHQPPRYRLSNPALFPLMQKGFNFLEKKGVRFNPLKNTKMLCPLLAVDNMAHVQSTLCDLFTMVGRQFQHQPELLFLVFPKKSSELYPELKKTADTVLGVPTQALVVEHVMKGSEMYWANVALKVNMKALLPPFQLQQPSSSSLPSSSVSPSFSVSFPSSLPKNIVLSTFPPYFSKAFMLIGVDVFHPPPGSSEPSIAGVVGSIDSFATRYVSMTSLQPPRQESIQGFEEIILTLLRKYHLYRHCYPERILVYRDGVGEGQFSMVLKTELHAIHQAYRTLGVPFVAQVTLIVVQKRHHTRFLAVNDRDMDRSGNAPSGLVVDEGIVHPTDFDFYLQSQQGLMGTCRPTHYSVLHDEYRFRSPDEIYLLTFHCCFLYARCFRPVKIVAPVYYAHLLCYRARYRLSGTLSSSKATSQSSLLEPLHSMIEESMYYL